MTDRRNLPILKILFKKKLIFYSLCIAVVFLFTYLVLDSTRKKTTLNVVTSHWTRSIQRKFIEQKIVKEFEKLKNIKVNLKFEKEKDLIKKIKSNYSHFDVIIINHSRAIDLLSKPDQYPIANLKNQMLQQKIEYSKIINNIDKKITTVLNNADNKLRINHFDYFLPIHLDIYLLCINISALRYAQDINLRNLSWKDLFKWASNIANANDNQNKTPFVIAAGASNAALSYQIRPMILSAGGSSLNIDSPEAKQVWKTLCKNNDIIHPLSYSYKRMSPILRREKGWIAFMHNGRIFELLKAKPNKFVVFKPPLGFDNNYKKKCTMLGVISAGIMKNSIQKRSAAIFINYLFSKEVQTQIATKIGSIPSNKESYGYILTNNTKEWDSTYHSLKLFIETINDNTLQFAIKPPRIDYDEIKAIYYKAFNEIRQSEYHRKKRNCLSKESNNVLKKLQIEITELTKE